VGDIIPNTIDDVNYWTEKRRSHQRLLNRRYNALITEFEDYIKYKNDLVYEAQRKPTATREIPPRAAKVKVLVGDFKGMTSRNSVGSKRKGKKGSSD